MSWSQAYLLLNASVLPAWALLIFLPKSKLTAGLVHSVLYPSLLGSVYLACLVAGIAFGQSAEGAGFSSIESVMAIFDHPNGVMIGWTHYLVFDLFVGAWIGREATREKLPHLAVVPCLLGAFMFGPVGLLLFVLLRFMLRKKVSLAE